MRGLAVCCFFLSGASGLIFQVIWSRHFSLVFGTTTLALSTVLSAFMGGLALGSLVAGRLADRLQNPLRAYALCEAGVGLSALLLPFAVSSFPALNSWAYQRFADSYVMLSAVRFAASAAVILVPTTLMGATLPLLSRYFVRSRAEHARVGLRVGTLYAVNTLGAVIGTLGGGMLLLPQLGLSTTNIVAAFTNLGLALVVAIGDHRQVRRPSRAVADPEIAELLDDVQLRPASTFEVAPLARRVALLGFGLSGATAMVYQVLWTRVLSMTIGSSVYSFTVVLATFLVGLAAGAAVWARLSLRTRNPVVWLAATHLVIAALVGVSYLLIDELPFVYLFFLRGRQFTAEQILWTQFAAATVIMLPATIAMGGIFPLTIRIYAGGVGRVGRDVGTAYSVNTLGAILGSFLAGFAVIPLLQLQPGIYAAACCNLGLAAVLLLLAPGRRRLQVALAALAVCAALAAPAVLPRWNLYQVSVGLFRPSVARDAMAQAGKWTRPKLVFYRDGISTTVSVEQWSAKHFSLKNNGKVDASTGADMPTQIAVGLLPLLLHPDAPKLRPNVALIGFASGVTAGAILQYPVRRLDVVELEPAILAASRFFEHVNNRPLKDSRTRVISDDGRNYLAATQKRYDVIINEPSNPWITGVSNLFTRDYFRIARDRLAPGGLLCTWAQMYELSPRRIKAIYRAFSDVFPHVYAFSATTLSSDTFLIGSMRPLELNRARLQRVFAIPSVAREMSRARIHGPEDITALTLLAPGEVDAFTIGARPNTDDNALVEFAAPRDLYEHKKYDAYISNIYGMSWSYGRLADFISGYRTSEQFAGLVRALLRQGRLREAREYFERVDEERGPRSRRVWELMRLVDPAEDEQGEFPLAEANAPLRRPHPPARWARPDVLRQMLSDYDDLLRLWAERDYCKAYEKLEKWPEWPRERAGPDVHLLWGYLVYKCGHYRPAVNILEPLLHRADYVRARPVVLFYLGKAYYANADFAKALTTFDRWIAWRHALGQPVVPEMPEVQPE